jgi:hypothetical protein
LSSRRSVRPPSSGCNRLSAFLDPTLVNRRLSTATASNPGVHIGASCPCVRAHRLTSPLQPSTRTGTASPCACRALVQLLDLPHSAAQARGISCRPTVPLKLGLDATKLPW